MTQREIASRARVSPSTVSRVLHKDKTVHRNLERRVRAVMNEVGYRPSYRPRSLASGKSRTLGLIVSELTGGNPFFSEIILHFERTAVENGYEVLVSFADTAIHRDQVAACAERMQRRRVDGIAVLTFGLEQCLIYRPIEIPMIYAGEKRDVPGAINIRINYLTGMKEAVSHLVGFGHQRIGYLSGNLGLSTMWSRYQAARNAINEEGLALDKELVSECDHTWEGGSVGILKLLNLPKPPTAVLCCNDVAAVGAMKSLRSRGLRAGEGVAVIGFDDLAICQFTQPPLTTIRFSPRELAQMAFLGLLEQIRGSESKSHFEYRTRLILRESTCAPMECKFYPRTASLACASSARVPDDC
jgi:DNA-binding LacI/PurR family transcriptional regulator